jgi:hypothetical protein
MKRIPDILKRSTLAACFAGADHFDIKTIEGGVGLRAFVAGMLSCHPWWVLALYRLRGLLVTALGLVDHEIPGALAPIAPEDLAFSPGETAAFFTVIDAAEDRFWVAKTPPDNHLSACFGVIRERSRGHRARYSVFTSVTYIHWTGPVYFNLIRPFHHLVVRRMMRAGVGR